MLEYDKGSAHRALQVGSVAKDGLEVGSAEVSPLQVSPAEISTHQVGTMQVCPLLTATSSVAHAWPREENSRLPLPSSHY